MRDGSVDVLEIDGSLHSGSGTIVRQSVAYAALIARPVRIRNAAAWPADAFRGPPGRPGTQPGAAGNVANSATAAPGCAAVVSLRSPVWALIPAGGQDPPDSASNPGWHTAIIQV